MLSTLDGMSETTLQPSQPIATSNRSSSPALAHINHSKSEISITPLPDTMALRTSSPTPSEKDELKVLDGTIRRMFRKESWKDQDFVSKLPLI